MAQVNDDDIEQSILDKIVMEKIKIHVKKPDDAKNLGEPEKPEEEQTIGEMIGEEHPELAEEKEEKEEDPLAFAISVLEERIGTISEQIGEVRGVVRSREESFKSMEEKINQFEEVMRHFQTTSLVKEFKENRDSIQLLRAELEKTKMLVQSLRNRFDKVEKSLEGIVSFENVVNVEERIKEEASKMDDVKKYVDRLGSKIEGIYDNLRNKITSIEQFDKRIEYVEELSKELMKNIDKVHLSEKDMTSKSDIEALKVSVDDKINELRNELVNLEKNKKNL